LRILNGHFELTSEEIKQKDIKKEQKYYKNIEHKIEQKKEIILNSYNPYDVLSIDDEDE